MILTPIEVLLIKPLLSMVEAAPHYNPVLHLNACNGRKVTLDISPSGIYIKAEFVDSAPAFEMYRNPMGLAQAYRVPLAHVCYAEED